MADDTQYRVTPLEGKTTADDKMVFEAERLGYESAADIAARIALEVENDIKGKDVVIAGAQLLADLANLQSAYLILEGLERDYGALATHARVIVGRRSGAEVAHPGDNLHIATEGLAAESVVAALSPVSAAAEAALGLISLFREDVEYKGVKTDVDRLAFEIALASRVRDAGADKVCVPDLTVLSAAAGEGTLRDRLTGVHQAKAAAWAAAGPLIAELVGLEAELDAAARDGKQDRVESLSARVSELRGVLQPLAGPLGRADQRLADLENQWGQVADSGVTLLARLLRAEAIRARRPAYLHAAVVASGGHNRISRSLFRMMFLGDGLSFVGGAVVRWALLAADGSVLKGGILVARRSRSSFRGDDVSNA